MPAFAYRAVHPSGRIRSGQRMAASENELIHDLQQSGLELISSREKKEKTAPLTRIVSGKAPPRALALFCARMHDLLSAGIPFIETLRDAERETAQRGMRNALAHIAQAIENGGGIAVSFALYPALFPPVFTAILASGEKSGEMVAVFAFLTCYTESRARIQENLRRALRYPLFLLLVAGSAVSFMLSIVVPQVVQFLVGIDGHLPLSTRLLVGLASLFGRWGWLSGLMLVSFIGLIILARYFFPSFAQNCDALFLRLPLIGRIILKTSLARFAHSFAILFHSGCDVPACLRQASGTVSNRALKSDLDAAWSRVQSGSALSAALEGVMPPLATGLLRTGERSGKLGKSLEDIAATYDREAQIATDSFIALLEPCLTLAIGGLLAWTVLAVLGPLYGSLSVLGERM